MKIFFQAVILLMSLQANTLDYLPRYFVVDQPDVPEEGWYWDPEHSGWGLNMTIQPASFTESGYYVQGAIYTYDENGNAFFYTFQNPYVPNPDVFAWREGRGLMGSFNSLLAESEGGNCLVCSHQQSSIAASDLGEVTIEWESPLKAVMKVGNRVIDIEHFYFQDGLRNPTADYIADSSWALTGLGFNYDYSPANPPFRPIDQLSWTFYGFKGVFAVDELAPNELNGITFEGLSDVGSDLNDLQWFVSKSNATTRTNFYTYDDSQGQTDLMFENDVIYAPFHVGTYRNNIYIAYDEDTTLFYVFYGLNDVIGVCENKIPTYFVAEYKPAVASEITAYHPYEQPDYFDCGTPANDMPLELKRQRVLNLTRIMPGNDDLSKIGFFSKH